jgi:hypothetical protein
MNVLTVYTPFPRSRLASPERAQYFMMNALLYSRMEAGYPTNHEFFDEDVNVYLAELLSSRIQPARPGGAGDPAPADAELFEAAAAASGDRARYEMYRRSADTLLLALGVFRNARGRRPGSARRFAPADDLYIGRGKTYYAVAASLATALARRSNAASAVLGKLSRGFERYLAALSHLAGEYLGIVRGISDGTLYHLARAAEPARTRVGLAEAYDRFLDLYSAYRARPTARGRRSLEEAVRALRGLDPSFAFDVGSLDRIKSL